jgi:carboxyl-terminal processing protease
MRRLLLPAVLLVCAAAVLPLPPVRADDVDEAAAARAVATLMAKAEGADVPELWSLSKLLAAGGKQAIPALREASQKGSPGARLAAGRALVLLEDELKGVESLQKLVGEDGVAAPVKVAALKVIGQDGEEEQSTWLTRAIDETHEPAVKVAMAKALWDLSSTSTADRAHAKKVFLDFLKSEDKDLRAEGALALGEIGAALDAKEALRELRDEPTERGRTAATLLRLINAEELADARLRTPPATPPAAAPKSAWPLLDEIRDLLNQSYVDESALAGTNVEDKMAAGVTEALDPHTEYYSPEENAKLLTLLDPTYGGVGAYVYADPENKSTFTISRPIFGGPIYRAGLQTGDMITKIDGQTTAGQGLDESVRRLKGPAGTKVVITVYRTGWTEEQDFSLTRARITIPTTAYDVLPGDLGFLEISTFADETAAEVHKILDEFQRRGVKALVIDLRWNTGGLLTAAVDIASEFLPKGALVVTEKGREGVMPPVSFSSKGTGRDRPSWPIVVLVNRGTASAAEILSGSLQAHGRARLVGEMTYGKGSVQLPIPLKSRPGEEFTDVEHDVVVRYSDVNGNGRWDPDEPALRRKERNGRYDGAEKFTDVNGNGRYDPGEPFVDANSDGVWNDAEPFVDANKNGKWDAGGAFKMTVARYYLPSGKHLEGKFEVKGDKVVRTGGIDPEVAAKPAEPDFWQTQELRKIDKTGAARRYVDAAMAKDPALFERLARSDRRDPSLYPGFDAFYDALKTRLSKEAVRQLVRVLVRRNLANQLSRELVGDLVDDEPLDVAILEALKALNVDPKSVDDLAFLAQPRAKPESDDASK